jgi:hypothetical protein
LPAEGLSRHAPFERDAEAREQYSASRAIDEAVTPELTCTIDWHRFVDWLPRLGTPLWLHRVKPEQRFPRARLLPHGVLLLDHPALAAFADCTQVSAHVLVGAHGPREWLEFRDTRDLCSARLYLLPDTDYLAWDGMLADCGILRIQSREAHRWHAHEAFMRCALSRRSSTWQAQAIRFPVLRLPCLQVLGLRAPGSLSLLGRQLASAIANDEHAALQGSLR